MKIQYLSYIKLEFTASRHCPSLIARKFLTTYLKFEDWPSWASLKDQRSTFKSLRQKSCSYSIPEELYVAQLFTRDLKRYRF